MPRSGDEFDGPDGEEAEQKTGRFSLLHRGGARVEVGEPVCLSDAKGERHWMCAVKLVGAKREDQPEDQERTHTLLVRTGRGQSPEEAQRNALAQLSLVYGTPTQPPPPVLITRKLSEPPPPQPKVSIWARVKGLFGMAKT